MMTKDRKGLASGVQMIAFVCRLWNVGDLLTVKGTIWSWLPEFGKGYWQEGLWVGKTDGSQIVAREE